MSERKLPRYPIYIPSKGRHDVCLTAQFLLKDRVPFRLVVEPQDYDNYASIYGERRLLTLPVNDPGTVVYARNWIKDHSTAEGHARHWQLDDNMYRMYRWHKGQRIQCASGPAFRVVEDFSDRYENVAISGMNYEMFGTGKQPPFHLNCRVYSCALVNNEIPHRYRGPQNEDTDICLQVLADGWCTVLVNAFLIMKRRTMRMKGGNSDLHYFREDGNGRLAMANALTRRWPGVVETKRRFHRPQHVVKDAWKRFDNQLKLKPGIDLEDLRRQKPDYGMKLRAVGDVQSEKLKEMIGADDG